MDTKKISYTASSVLIQALKLVKLRNVKANRKKEKKDKKRQVRTLPPRKETSWAVYTKLVDKPSLPSGRA